MSERPRHPRETPESTDTAPSASRGRPGPIHEELYNKIMDDVLKVVQEYAPTFGTVVGRDGGRVKVHIDDEDDPRDVGFTRKKGQRYPDGERVKVQKTRSGAYIADGTYSTKNGRDPAVDSDDLYGDAVDTTHIRHNAVNNDKLAGDSVDYNNLRNDVKQVIQNAENEGKEGQRQAQQAQNAANQAQNAANQADNRAQNAQNKADNADNKAVDAKNAAQDAKNLAQGAQNTANRNSGDINSIQADIKNIKDRLDKLEKKDKG